MVNSCARIGSVTNIVLLVSKNIEMISEWAVDADDMKFSISQEKDYLVCTDKHGRYAKFPISPVSLRSPEDFYVNKHVVPGVKFLLAIYPGNFKIVPDSYLYP